LDFYSNVTRLFTIPSFSSSGGGVGVEINSIMREGVRVGSSWTRGDVLNDGLLSILGCGVLKEALREPVIKKFDYRRFKKTEKHLFLENNYFNLFTTRGFLQLALPFS
jgi:hypothetical protein